VKRLSLMIVVFSLLSGCSLYSREPARQTYLLTPTPTRVIETPTAHLKLGTISAVPGLDRSRIVLHVSPYRMDHYASARWPDNLPNYLRAVFLENLSMSHVTDSVSTGNIGATPNYALELRVLDFQAEYSHSIKDIPEVFIQIELTLLRPQSQELVLHKWYTSHKQASENRMSAIISSFNEAFQEVQDTMIQDINQAIIQDLADNTG
jgi:ABC-type uncharacterized transport system auxiliary subunit